MEPQVPAEGVMLRHKHPTWRSYDIPCTCGCDEAIQVSLEIENDDDPFITCHITSMVKTAYWKETFPVTYREKWLVLCVKQLANDVIRRVSIAFTALTKGYVEMESYTLLSTQQAATLSATMLTAAIEIEKEAAEKHKARAERVKSKNVA